MSSEISSASVNPSRLVLWITPWERNAASTPAAGYTTNELSSLLGFAVLEIEALLTRLFATMGGIANRRHSHRASAGIGDVGPAERGRGTGVRDHRESVLSFHGEVP
jgi:hypothetical protein